MLSVSLGSFCLFLTANIYSLLCARHGLWAGVPHIASLVELMVRWVRLTQAHP